MRARSSRADEVERVRRQLEQWRRRRDRGRRIPEPLWKAVVKLARGHGVSKTALALRLDYYAIKKRLEAAEPTSPAIMSRAPGAGVSGGRFVELPLRAMPTPPACVLEVEDGRGARLRLELQGLGAGELAGVVRSVWSEPR
jgi:hypothetical protein